MLFLWTTLSSRKLCTIGLPQNDYFLLILTLFNWILGRFADDSVPIIAAFIWIIPEAIYIAFCISYWKWLKFVLYKVSGVIRGYFCRKASAPYNGAIYFIDSKSKKQSGLSYYVNCWEKVRCLKRAHSLNFVGYFLSSKLFSYKLIWKNEWKKEWNWLEIIGTAESCMI